MPGPRKKRGGSSLSLPFEEFAHPSPSLASGPSKPKVKSRPSTSAEDTAVSLEDMDSSGQLTLWTDLTPPSPLPDAPAPPPLKASVNPPSASAVPAEKIKPDNKDERPSLFNEPLKDRKKPRPSAELDDASFEAAAEALGLNLDDLRVAAQENELRLFWSFLRSQAARRVQELRAAKQKKDPFDWDSPALAAVPGFVEDRAAVEILYYSLRNEDFPG
jgi:hypothetical protein